MRLWRVGKWRPPDERGCVDEMQTRAGVDESRVLPRNCPHTAKYELAPEIVGVPRPFLGTSVVGEGRDQHQHPLVRILPQTPQTPESPPGLHCSPTGSSLTVRERGEWTQERARMSVVGVGVL